MKLTVLGASGSRTYQLETTGVYAPEKTIDLSAFAGETVTLRFETKGVEASFQDFRKRIDSDGDDIWNHVERQRWYHPRLGSSFSTDPFSADSDGDGLDDDREVTFSKDFSGWEVASAISDPSEVDSDGDGLTDSEEWEGYEIRVIDSHNDAKQFMAALGQGGDVSQYVTTRTVRTAPARADTDGDGLDDGTEQELGTDATEADTDGDGVTDRRERVVNEDSTVRREYCAFAPYTHV